MDTMDFSALLSQLIDNWENEVVEFKRGNNGLNTDKLGKYFSALANEANLRKQERGWLVLGVDDKTRSVCGTSYRLDHEDLQKDMERVSQGTNGLTFRGIHVHADPIGRVVLFQIPAGPRGVVVEWKGHKYGRRRESLVSLSQDKYDEIRSQSDSDWSAKVVSDATLSDLDENALRAARKAVVANRASRFTSDQISKWTDTEFLNRAKISEGGKITRTALLLLGKAESAWMLNPNPAEIVWKHEEEERVYEIYRPPFLLATSQLFSRIHNPQLQILPDSELIPRKISKYDQKVVMEALHNCIAHQNYLLDGRISVLESSGHLVFQNLGDFFDGHPLDYVLRKRMPNRYRNNFLRQAMVELNMIDSMGYGILDIFKRQRDRFLPLPDYDLESEKDVVRLTIHGSVVDEAYSRLLIRETGIDLDDVFALDRVQKKLPIREDMARRLRNNKMIEGRRPNIQVSAKIAAASGGKAKYIHDRARRGVFFETMITDFLNKFGEGTRSEIDELLLNKLNNSMTRDKKARKISQLLTKMRTEGIIVNVGSRKSSLWRLAKDTKEIQD